MPLPLDARWLPRGVDFAQNRVMSQNPPGLQTSPLPPPPPGPLGPPKVDMMASREMQNWIARLEAQHKTVGKRNRWLAVALALGVAILLAALGAVYRSAVGSYEVVNGLTVTRDPASQGRIGIRFDVPHGKVVYHRTSGKIETEVIDYFSKTGPVDRWWGWVYEPGEKHRRHALVSQRAAAQKRPPAVSHVQPGGHRDPHRHHRLDGPQHRRPQGQVPRLLREAQAAIARSSHRGHRFRRRPRRALAGQARFHQGRRGIPELGDKPAAVRARRHPPIKRAGCAGRRALAAAGRAGHAPVLPDSDASYHNPSRSGAKAADVARLPEGQGRFRLLGAGVRGGLSEGDRGRREVSADGEFWQGVERRSRPGGLR